MARKLTASAMLSGLVATVLATVASARIMFVDIESPDECGDYLNVSAKELAGEMVQYVVRIDPDEAEHNELYKGRIKAGAHLEISTADSKLASMQLKPSYDKNETIFRFQLASHLREHTLLTVATHLYEKDDFPTLGGGKVFQISLKGFPPTNAPH